MYTKGILNSKTPTMLVVSFSTVQFNIIYKILFSSNPMTRMKLTKLSFEITEKLLKVII